jgi:hypothetical protein
LNQVLGAQAFAVDVYPGYEMVTFDSETPGTFTVIGPVGGSTQYFAGDFVGGDFSKLYVADYGTNTLYTLSTTDASVTTVGPAVPGGGETWSGLTGAPDGTLYGVATTCGSSSLYTLDPDTGTATLVGPITNGACMIDIAANADGELFGVDIVSDVLVQIDPATGAGTVIGSVGINANYAQGMDFEEESGILYWAAYSSSGELRIIDTATGNSTLVGGFPGGDEVDDLAFATGGEPFDIPWLSENPTSGVVAADSESIIDVTFDAMTLTAGSYNATLVIDTGDPMNPSIAVPVTMNIVGEAAYGVEVSPDQALEGNAGDTVEFTVVVTNTGNVSDVFTLELGAHDYDATLSATSITLAAGASGTFTVSVVLPAGGIPSSDVIPVIVTSTGDDTVTATTNLTASIIQTIYNLFLPIISKLP